MATFYVSDEEGVDVLWSQDEALLAGTPSSSGLRPLQTPQVITMESSQGNQSPPDPEGLASTSQAAQDAGYSFPRFPDTRGDLSSGINLHSESLANIE